MKKALSIVLSLILLLSVIPVGTISAGAAEDDVIEIRTIAELYNINNNMSGNYKLMNDIDMTNDVAVGGDWDFMGNGWEPIGSNGIYTNTAFTGTFDGDGHKIIGMRINLNNYPSGTGDVYLGLFANNAGTIKNLRIDSMGIVKNGSYIGGVCAYNSGTILDCFNEASISSSTYSGGICGYNHGNIYNCCNNANVSSSGFSGGICGSSQGASSITNCYNTGNISSSNKSTTYSGGICGDAYYAYVIRNCYNTGEIKSSASTNSYLPKPTGSSGLSAYSRAYCGGICGDSSGKIEKCFNSGVLVSYAYSYAELGKVDEKVYSRPDGSASAYSYTYTGGICGRLSYSSINSCYNTQKITSTVKAEALKHKSIDKGKFYTFSSETIKGTTETQKYCGGIAGQSDNVIDSCYNIGETLFGIKGTGSGNITNCYYLNTAGSSNTGAKALTDAQLQLEMCMPDFDFENTWVLDKATEYKYPQLKNNRQELATNPESIEITLPDKTSYIVGEEFDPSGLVVMGHYTNGVEQEISFYDISGFTCELGKNNITVTVGEKSAVFYVTVHDEGEWTTTKEPTCTENGEKKLYCTDCGELLNTEVIPAKGHKEVVNKGHEATCTESGLTDGSHCSVCKTILIEQKIIPAKGHTPYQNWETIKNPTCISHGEKVRYCSVCGEIAETANIDVTDHQIAIDESKEATCLTSGLTEGSHCSVCNTVIVPQQVIQPKGHQWDEGEIITQPTCTKTGEKIYHCKNCEQTKTETISALGHDYSDEFTIDTAATCTEDGSKSRHCSRCEAVTDVTVIEKTGHSWDNGTVTKQPSCTTTGEKLYCCKNCGHFKTETIAIIGHKFADTYTIDKAPTCTENGLKSRHCLVCDNIADETVIEKTGHSWDDGTVTKQSTCTAAGEKVYRCKNCEESKTETISALGHNFSDEYTIDKAATCTQNGEKSRHCSRCEAVADVTVVEKHGHIWDDGTVTKQPTCTATGEKVYHCKNCDKTYTETISALGHNFSDEFTIDKEATCNQDGSKSRHCSRCNAVTDVTTIEKHNHIWDDGIVTKKPTCTTEGVKTYHCQKCEQTKAETISVLGHKFSDEYTVDKAATCTQDGIKSRHCSRCEAYTDEVVIEKLGHNFSDEYTVDKEATCTENGSKSRHCSRCDACTDETIIEKHGHDWNDGTVTKQPTCTTTGEKVYNCKNCEQTKTEALYALGHDYSDEFTIDKEATCTEDGSKSRHCTRCEAHTDEVVIEKNGHHTELVSNHAATYFANGYTGDNTCTVCGKVISKGEAIAKLKLATPKVKITAGKQKLTVKYTKVKNATGFQVKYTYKGKTTTKTYTSKKSVTKTIKKLKKGTYKVSVRALIKSNGKTAYSGWTKTTKVKVK